MKPKNPKTMTLNRPQKGTLVYNVGAQIKRCVPEGPQLGKCMPLSFKFLTTAQVLCICKCARGVDVGLKMNHTK